MENDNWKVKISLVPNPMGSDFIRIGINGKDDVCVTNMDNFSNIMKAFETVLSVGNVKPDKLHAWLEDAMITKFYEEKDLPDQKHLKDVK